MKFLEMNRLKRAMAVIAVFAMIGLSTTSCHRDGCPNNFKLDGVDELVQEILQ